MRESASEIPCSSALKMLALFGSLVGGHTTIPGGAHTACSYAKGSGPPNFLDVGICEFKQISQVWLLKRVIFWRHRIKRL